MTQEFVNLGERELKIISKNEPSWFVKLRQDAFEKFQKLPVPKFRYGISLFTNLKDLNFDSLNPKKQEINFDSPYVKTIEQALKEDSKILKDYFMARAYYYGENKLTALHTAFCTNALIVQIPDDEIVKKPIEISIDSKGTSITHVLVIAGRNSKVTIAEIQTGKGFKSHGTEVFAMEGSTVNYETLQDHDEWNFDIKRAVIGKDANVNWFTALLKGKLAKIEISSDLAGEGARSHNFGLFIGKEENKFDIYNSSIHSASNTYSDMNNKGVVFDKAKSIYRGLINIKENARNCDGYQKQDTLMLSDEAEADAIPNLEINNNAVRCSHGATIGKIDEEDIFYMMSRGLSKKEAEQEIVKGFLGSMSDNAFSEKFKEIIAGRI